MHILHHTDCLREVNATIEQEKRFCVAVDLVRGGAPLSEIEAECNEKMRLDIFGSSSARRNVIIWHRVKAVSPRALVPAALPSFALGALCQTHTQGFAPRQPDKQPQLSKAQHSTTL